MKLRAGTTQALLILLITVSFVVSPLAGGFNNTGAVSVGLDSPSDMPTSEKLERVMYGVDSPSVSRSYITSSQKISEELRERMEKYDDSLETEGGPVDSESETFTDGKIMMYVEVSDDSEVKKYDFEVTETYKKGETKVLKGLIPVVSIDDLSSEPWVEYMGLDNPITTQVSDVFKRAKLNKLHQLGVTGSGVKVGIIGSNFKTYHYSISSNIADYQRFFNSQTRPRETSHGTAVAEVVAETAPSSDLYLAATGDEVTPLKYETAIEWLQEREVDVIVYSGSFPNQPLDGRVSSITQRVIEDGTVFVTSAGNYANRHWTGETMDKNSNDWIEFGNKIETNFLNNGKSFSGRVEVRLSWNDWPETDKDYDLYLYRHDIKSGRRQLIAKSTRKQSGQKAPYESISAKVPEGKYYVSIYSRDGETGTSLELYSTYQSLSYSTTKSSIPPPGTVKNAITVGAYDYRNNTVEYFSSRGPVNGTVGIDIIASNGIKLDSIEKRFDGTSASAPYVAGVTALLLSEKPGLTPESVEKTLRSTATDIGKDGPDNSSGYGKIDVFDAIRKTSTEIRKKTTNTTTSKNKSITDLSLRERFLRQLSQVMNTSKNTSDLVEDGTTRRSQNRTGYAFPISTDDNENTTESSTGNSSINTTESSTGNSSINTTESSTGNSNETEDASDNQTNVSVSSAEKIKHRGSLSFEKTSSYRRKTYWYGSTVREVTATSFI